MLYFIHSRWTAQLGTVPMPTKSVALPLVAAALLLALALVGLDVVDSARTIVVVAGYLWFAILATIALTLALITLRARRAR